MAEIRAAGPTGAQSGLEAARPGTVTVRREDAGGAWRLGLAGEHDLSTMAAIERRTVDALAVCSRAIVDLGDATFIDCSVINWLLRTERTLAGDGRSLVVVDFLPHSVVARAIDVLGIRRQVAFEPVIRGDA